MDQSELQIPTGLKKPQLGSRAGFDRLWARYRAQIQSDYDPVAAGIRFGSASREAMLASQRKQLTGLDRAIDAAWQGQLGDIWRFLGKIDRRLLEKQLGDLALIQADDCRAGSGKWQALEGVMNLLGSLGDLLRGLEAGHGR